METNRSVFRLSTLCSDVMNQPVPALKIELWFVDKNSIKELRFRVQFQKCNPL